MGKSMLFKTKYEIPPPNEGWILIDLKVFYLTIIRNSLLRRINGTTPINKNISGLKTPFILYRKKLKTDTLSSFHVLNIKR